MRCLTFVAVLFLLPILTTAQEATLISGDMDHGGYGGLVTKVTRINGEAGAMVGAEGAWIIDHTAYLGFQGTGLMNRIDAKKLQPSGRPYVLRLNEYGVRAGYIHNSDDLVHFSAGAIVGGGSMLLTERYVWTDDSDFHWDSDQMYFLVEPEVAAEINLTKWMRALVGASYRIVAGADYEGMTSSDLSGPAGTVTLKFGSF